LELLQLVCRRVGGDNLGGGQPVECRVLQVVQGHSFIEIHDIFALLIGNTIAIVRAVESSVERAETSGMLGIFVLPKFVIWLLECCPVSDKDNVYQSTATGPDPHV
jgi:hypothetical protein